MASKFRIFTRGFFFYTNIAVVLFFLLSCLAPYIDPRQAWFISFLGLGFPILLILVLVFLFSWLVMKPRYALISAFALIMGIQSIRVFFAINNPGAFHFKKDPGTIRIVSWNVARFVEMKRNNNKGSQVRLKMMDLIRQQDADILCFQEFFHSLDSQYYLNIDYIRDNLHYPYWYYSHDVDGDKHYTGSIIFSRYPIIDSAMIRYPRPTLPDALMHADIVVGKDTIRVYTTHLQSLQFGKQDYQRINQIEGGKDSLLTNSKNIVSKIRKGFVNRSIQANIIKQVLEDSPHPLIMCADLNDVPNSYTYFRIRGKLQDAFLAKGFGIGRTFTTLSPTLRIDYIFADANFRIKQFNRPVKNYSDHYMIVSDLELKKAVSR
jgi:endonuclease/exonuclease/phosphatase family metal-dependent hydrolase